MKYSAGLREEQRGQSVESEERRLRGLIKTLQGADASERERAAGVIAEINGWKAPENQRDVWVMARLVKDSLDIESDLNRGQLLGAIASWFYVAERDKVLGEVLDAYKAGLGPRWSAEAERIAASVTTSFAGASVLAEGRLEDDAAGAAGPEGTSRGSGVAGLAGRDHGAEGGVS